MTEWLQAKLSRLRESSNVDEKKDILIAVKIKLWSLSSSDAEDITTNIDFGELFPLLTSDDREFVDQICDVLKDLFKLLQPDEVYRRYSAKLSELMVHPDPTVRLFVLQQILSITSDPRKLPILLTDVSFLVAVVNRIADEDLAVAKSAVRVMKEVGKDPGGMRIVYKGELLRSFARLLHKNDVVTFRVYEVVVDIAKSSKEGLEASVQSGFLHSLLGVLENEDILLQLNALEILTELALTEDGLSYLEQEEVLKKLALKIANAEENPLDNLLIPGLMKLFGNVAKRWPDDIFCKYTAVVLALFKVIEAEAPEDPTILASALDILGYVASTMEGKYALNRLGETMTSALRKIAVIIERMPTSLMVRGLNNLALILGVEKSKQDQNSLSLTKSWFDSICDDPMKLIVSQCRKPFADIRLAGLEVLAVLAFQPWGQEYVSKHPGLVEFLLDRNVEAFKECKEAKYQVVKYLSEAEDVFDADTLQKLKLFVSQGPHYVETYSSVAVEGL